VPAIRVAASGSSEWFFAAYNSPGCAVHVSGNNQQFHLRLSAPVPGWPDDFVAVI